MAVAALMLYIGVNTLRTTPHSSTGPAAGRALPPFAMPLVESSSDKDANVATAPDEGERGTRPACEVRGPAILNSCELTERGPLVLTFFTTIGGDRCLDQLDVVERVRRRHPGVGFAAVAIRGDRTKIRRLAHERGWRLPIGYDRDGLVTNLYGVPVCPMIVLARQGGATLRTAIGTQTATQLDAAVRQLVAASRTR